MIGSSYLKEGVIELIELRLIKRSKFNLRDNLYGIEELIESIKIHGLLQPLIVRPAEGYFELITGSRRLEALKRLRIRGDVAKLITLVKLIALLNQRTLPRLRANGKEVIIATPAVALQALKLAAKPMGAMWAGVEKRFTKLLDALEELGITDAYNTMEPNPDTAEIGPETRAKLAMMLCKDERTVRRYLDALANRGLLTKVRGEGRGRPNVYRLQHSLDTIRKKISGTLDILEKAKVNFPKFVDEAKTWLNTFLDKLPPADGWTKEQILRAVEAESLDALAEIRPPTAEGGLSKNVLDTKQVIFQENDQTTLDKFEMSNVPEISEQKKHERVPIETRHKQFRDTLVNVLSTFGVLPRRKLERKLVEAGFAAETVSSWLDACLKAGVVHEAVIDGKQMVCLHPIKTRLHTQDTISGAKRLLKARINKNDVDWMQKGGLVYMQIKTDTLCEKCGAEKTSYVIAYMLNQQISVFSRCDACFKELEKMGAKLKRVGEAEQATQPVCEKEDDYAKHGLIKCPYCSFYVFTEADLWRHIQACHPKEAEKVAEVERRVVAVSTL